MQMVTVCSTLLDNRQRPHFLGAHLAVCAVAGVCCDVHPVVPSLGWLRRQCCCGPQAYDGRAKAAECCCTLEGGLGQVKGGLRAAVLGRLLHVATDAPSSNPGSCWCCCCTVTTAPSHLPQQLHQTAPAVGHVHLQHSGGGTRHCQQPGGTLGPHSTE